VPDLGPRELIALVQRVVERERLLGGELAERLLAPVELVFDLLEDSGATLRREAEALETAGRALQDTAALIKRQAELFEQTIGALREPAELVRAAAGLERRQKRPRAGGAGGPDGESGVGRGTARRATSPRETPGARKGSSTRKAKTAAAKPAAGTAKRPAGGGRPARGAQR
jgi:hypothetical protein